jgi:TfoX/Sxy family transcriptional regulator of competence genes
MCGRVLMASNPKTLDRVRHILSRQRVVEKRMVGGSLGFVVNGKLCVSVGENRILVRVDKAFRLQLLKKPGARPMNLYRSRWLPHRRATQSPDPAESRDHRNVAGQEKT